MKRKLACLLTSCIVAVAAAMPAFATAEDTDFVPSVEPESSARIKNAHTTIDGHEYDSLDELEEAGYILVVTSLADADNAPNAEITTALKAAKADVDAGLKFISSDDEAKFAGAEAAAEAAGKELKNKEIVDVSLLKADTKEIVPVDDITFSLEIGDADQIKVATHKPADAWEVIGEVPYVAADSTTATITTSSLSPFAFYVEAAVTADDSQTDDSQTDNSSNTDDSKTDDSKTDDSKAGDNSQGGGTSPDTGTSNGLLYAIPAAVAVVGGIVLVKRAKKN